MDTKSNNNSKKFWEYIFKNKEHFTVHYCDNPINGKKHFYISEYFDEERDFFFYFKSNILPIKIEVLNSLNEIDKNIDFFNSEEYKFGLGKIYVTQILNQIMNDNQEPEFIDYIKENILKNQYKYSMIYQPLTDKAFSLLLSCKEHYKTPINEKQLDYILKKLAQIEDFNYDLFKDFLNNNNNIFNNKVKKLSIIDFIKKKSPKNLEDFKQSFKIKESNEDLYTIVTDLFSCKINKEQLFSNIKLKKTFSIKEKDYFNLLSLINKGINSLKKELGIDYFILVPNRAADKNFSFLVEPNKKFRLSPETFSNGLMKSIQLFSEFPKDHKLTNLDLQNISNIFKYEELQLNLKSNVENQEKNKKRLKI